MVIGLAGTMWLWSTRLHHAGHPRAARAVKAVNFSLHHTLLPTQATVDPSVRVEHHGLGVVIHPNVVIGKGVVIWQNVTIASETKPGSSVMVRIEDDVMLGAGALIVARPDQGLTIGRGASIGAGAVVTRDVPPGAVMVGPAARAVP